MFFTYIQRPSLVIENANHNPPDSHLKLQSYAVGCHFPASAPIVVAFGMEIAFFAPSLFDFFLPEGSGLEQIF